MRFMPTLVLSTLVALGSLSVASAQTVPCKEMLKSLREAEATLKVDGATTAMVADLEATGVERCNADDDKRADTFFAEALKLLGK